MAINTPTARARKNNTVEVVFPTNVTPSVTESPPLDELPLSEGTTTEGESVLSFKLLLADVSSTANSPAISCLIPPNMEEPASSLSRVKMGAPPCKILLPDIESSSSVCDAKI